MEIEKLSLNCSLEPDRGPTVSALPRIPISDQWICPQQQPDCPAWAEIVSRQPKPPAMLESEKLACLINSGGSMFS